MVWQFIFGSILGSFLCLVAHRVPVKQSIFAPASHCTTCHQRLGFFDLIPLLSILYLRFCCRHCGTRLSPMYFFSEVAVGSIVCFAATQPHPLYTFFFLSSAVVFSLTDLFYLIVEPRLLFPLMLLLFRLHFFLGFSFYGLTGAGLFTCLHLINHSFPQSVGGGDICLVTLWAVLLPFDTLVFLLFAASSLGLIIQLVSLLYYKHLLEPLPFVPFLAAGLLIAWVCT